MRNVDDIYPLTPMQRLMLLHAVTAPDAGVLANRVCYEIRGPLDAAAFRRAWEALVRRHAALRTAVLWDGLDRPVQVVRSEVDLPFTELDLAHLSAAGRAERIDALWSDEASRPFELGRAPLMRCTLVRTGQDRHTLVWNIHHLVVDRWSHGILLSDLATLYRTLLAGETPGLRPATGFREYVAWVKARDPGAAERFWREELAGFVRPTLVAGNGARAAPHERHTTRRTLPAAAFDRLLARASEWRTPPASLVLGAVGLAIARRLRTDDVVFGLTVSGRPPELDGVEEAVGSFVNNVPLRVRLEPARTLAAWVREIGRGQADRQPFDWLSPATIRDAAPLSSSPLFDLLVVPNLETVAEGDWPFEMRPVRTTLDSGFPLTLGVGRAPPSLELVLTHHPVDRAAAELLDEVGSALGDLLDADGSDALADLLPEAGARRAGVARTSDRERAAPAAVPASDLAGTLMAIWKEVLAVDELGLDDDFFALGGTSLDAARAFDRLERATGRSVPLSTLVDGASVRSLLAALDGGSGPAGPMVPLQPGGRGAPVFAVPGIGGNVVGLLPLARELAGDRPFYAFQSRGLDGAAEPRTSIGAIAGDFVDAMPPRAADGRAHLVGVCWGAAVAFEMARLLRSRGRPPTSLTLLDPATLLRRTPAAPPGSPLLALLRRRARLYLDEFREGDWSDRGRLLARKARAAGRLIGTRGLPDDTRAELDRKRVRQANRAAIERYDPGPLEARVRIFLTSERALPSGDDPRLEWLSLLRPSPEVRRVPGVDSGDAISGNVAAFASALRDWLREVEEARPRRSAPPPSAQG